MLCYVGEDDEDIAEEGPKYQQLEDHVITTDLSHLQSLDGNNRSRPFRVTESIGSTEVSVFIGTGSTHDFLHP